MELSSERDDNYSSFQSNKGNQAKVYYLLVAQLLFNRVFWYHTKTLKNTEIYP